MSEQINVPLRNPVEYDFKGEKVQASFVTIDPPTTKHIHLTSVLKQAFQVSAMKISRDRKENGAIAEEKESGVEEKLSPSDIISMIYSGGDSINIKKVMLTGVDLLTSGIVLIEGEQKLTRPICESLCQDDYEEILGTILINFIIASLLDTKN